MTGVEYTLLQIKVNVESIDAGGKNQELGNEN